MENVNEMAVQFSNLVNQALDEIAPVKTFNNKPGYKAGISTETKNLMKERDMARSELKHSTGDKWIALQMLCALSKSTSWYVDKLMR